jgi:ubiquitin carboxyl-terminal hydrolase 48
MPPKSTKGQSKASVDKLAWKWAETTEPTDIKEAHLQSAYRLNLKWCDHTGQRRNCKGNPQCLIGLGEKEWLGEIADENWHDIEDPNNERRKKVQDMAT